MKRNEVTEILESLKEVPGMYIWPFRYWLGFDTSLLMMGVIDDIDHIDVYCRDDLFFSMAMKFSGTADLYDSWEGLLTIDNITFRRETGSKPDTINVNGYSCMTLMYIKRYYRYLYGYLNDNRSMRRIREINNFLSNKISLNNEHYIHGYNSHYKGTNK